MPHRAFFAFLMPSLLAMVLFILLPLISVGYQSLFSPPRDIEADEVFVVLSGSASVDFVDGSPSLRLGPGDVVRLAAATQTVWTVHETLRKVYLTQL